MQNVVVTGGAGYIGSHCCKVLAQHGFQPITIDNLCTGHAHLVKWGPLEKCDLRQTEQLITLFRKYQPVAVMHFAAFSDVGESVTQPDKYFNNNGQGTLSLLQAMIVTNIKHIVFSSTCATYGIHDEVIVETTQQSPTNPYGWSKLHCEQMIREIAQAHELHWTLLRYFNVAGADPEGETGEEHHPEKHIIPVLLEVIAGKRDQFTLFGSDYPTPDGTCIRDYVHVMDLVEAHVLALKDQMTHRRSDFFNLSYNQGFSNLEIVKEVEEVTQKKVPLVMGDRRPGDPPQLVGNSDKIRRTLGWQPRFHSLAQMIESAWQYYPNNARH